MLSSRLIYKPLHTLTCVLKDKMREKCFMSVFVSSQSEFYQSCCCCILLFLLFLVLQSLLGLCQVQASYDHLLVDVGPSPSPFKSFGQSINKSIKNELVSEKKHAQCCDSRTDAAVITELPLKTRAVKRLNSFNRNIAFFMACWKLYWSAFNNSF